MKKSIILSALSIAVIMTSCKKEEKNEFTQTDVTGTAVIKGNVGKNVFVPDVNNGFYTQARIASSGINVTIKINLKLLRRGHIHGLPFCHCNTLQHFL